MNKRDEENRVLLSEAERIIKENTCDFCKANPRLCDYCQTTAWIGMKGRWLRGESIDEKKEAEQNG